MRISPIQSATPLAIKAKEIIKLERSGKYEEALAKLSDISVNPDLVPDISDLTPAESAETLLRFGSLVGFNGFKHQINGEQDRSRDILTAARETFIELKNTVKTAECENNIALTYWRTSEYREAETWLDTAMGHDLSNAEDARLYTHVIRSLVYLSETRYEENILNCLAIEDDMRLYGDAFLNGSLCTNIGLSFKNFGDTSQAMSYLSLARDFHERSRHKPYLGTVQNNLAQLHKMERRFELAHETADAAIKTYRQLKDRNREASTIDTKAQVYFAEGRFTEALAAADRSIKMLKTGDVSVYLAESFLTRSKVLLKLGRFSDAVFSLIDAVNITRLHHSEDAAKKLVEEFAIAINEKETHYNDTQTVDKDELELVLPASIADYPEYKGVWINTSYLENIGIKNGSLVIVVPAKVERGDLVAISENDGGSVICGFYDMDFGIVCLERGDDEPLLFDQQSISILGKIVGVCKNGRDENGKLVVESLKI